MRDLLDPTDIYDPNNRSLPKTKHIFKITKESRNGSCNSTSSNIDRLRESNTNLVYNGQDDDIALLEFT